MRRLTSIGKPLDDVEVMIVTEDGNPVEGDGEVGEIVARGPRMMTGILGPGGCHEGHPQGRLAVHRVTWRGRTRMAISTWPAGRATSSNAAW